MLAVNPCIINVIYLDFDKVDFSILLYKIIGMGITGKLEKTLMLVNRAQFFLEFVLQVSDQQPVIEYKILVLFADITISHLMIYILYYIVLLLRDTSSFFLTQEVPGLLIMYSGHRFPPRPPIGQVPGRGNFHEPARRPPPQPPRWPPHMRLVCVVVC